MKKEKCFVFVFVFYLHALFIGYVDNWRNCSFVFGFKSHVVDVTFVEVETMNDCCGVWA